MKIVRINVENVDIRFEEVTSDSKYFLLGARGLTSQIILVGVGNRLQSVQIYRQSLLFS